MQIHDSVAVVAPVQTRETHSGVRQTVVRADIQALRGLAVALVVADHLGVPFVSAGFLGVDIFFVISGYLMTGLIAKDLALRTFSLQGFYARRVRRLLPACYATIGVTAVTSLLLLDPFELRNLTQQVAGAFTFTTNIVLWRQVDYFNSLSELKPLLHLWSLAVEEQYYLLLPVAMLFCPQRFLMRGTAVLTIASLLLCFYFVQRSPSAAFYFLPFRAWELGVGSLTALAVQRWHWRSAHFPRLRVVCAAVLVLVPVFGSADGHPGWMALIVCIATAWILATSASINGARFLLPAVWLGDRSYSLYLVHWPVLALAHNIYIDRVPTMALAALATLIIALTELQYRMVEQRFRQMRLDWRTLIALVAFPVAVLAAMAAGAWTHEAGGSEDRLGNPGLSKNCDGKGPYVPLAACQSQPNPRMLVWGDSFAMHLVPALAATVDSGIAQATRSVCGPLLGIAPLDNALRKRPWAEQCISFNDSVVAHLKAHPEIETVVLSTVLKQYVPGAEPEKDWRFLSKASDGFKEIPQDAMSSRRALEATVDMLRSMGKKVILIAPPPSADFDIGRCLSREDSRSFTIFPSSKCDIPLARYLSARRPVLSFLSDLEKGSVVPVLTFDQLLCDVNVCKTRLSAIPLYNDAAHLSIPGSRALGLQSDLGARVRAEAR